MILPALLLAGIPPSRESEIAKWVYEKDLSVVETPVDRRSSVKGDYKAVPPRFTFAGAFPETSAFSLLTFRIGDRLTKEFLDVATGTPDDKEAGSTEFEAYAGSLFSATVTYRVGKDNRVRAMSYWGKRFPEDAEVYYDVFHTVLTEKLGQPTDTVKREEKETPYFAEFWRWSDGSYLTHMIQFSDTFCAQFLYLSLPTPDEGKSSETGSVALGRRAASEMRRAFARPLLAR